MEDSISSHNHTPPPLSEMASALLSNPEARNRLMQLLSLSDAPRTDAAEASSLSDVPPANVEPPATPPSTDAFSALFSNPELLSRLPQMIGLLKPLLSSSAPPAPHSEKQTPEVCRNDLLLALKPFLSAERCAAVDSILQIARLSAIFKQLQ